MAMRRLDGFVDVHGLILFGVLTFHRVCLIFVRPNTA